MKTNASVWKRITAALALLAALLTLAACGEEDDRDILEDGKAYIDDKLYENIVLINGIAYSEDRKTLVKCSRNRPGTVTILDGVTSIGRSAFSDCTKLTSVTIPDSVTSIGGWYAFEDCSSLTSITLPVSLVPAGSFASYTGGFAKIVSGYTSLAVVLTGSGAIGDKAFSYCTGLTSVTIPDGVTSIGDLAFYDCTGLTSVTFEGSNTTITSGYASTFPSGSSLLSAGGASYSNGYKMAAGTYTRTSGGSTWTKQK